MPDLTQKSESDIIFLLRLKQPECVSRIFTLNNYNYPESLYSDFFISHIDGNSQSKWKRSTLNQLWGHDMQLPNKHLVVDVSNYV